MQGASICDLDCYDRKWTQSYELTDRMRSHAESRGRSLYWKLAQIYQVNNMPGKEYHLPETFLKIIRKDRNYSIFILEGENLIFFPA